jgi:hypothetical protein
MIVFEDGIEAIVNQIPLIDGFKPNFHWGNRDELTRWIGLQQQPYPIVWLVAGKEKHSEKGLKYVTRDCSFILATRNLEEDQLNDIRLRSSFDMILIPLADRLIEGVTKSNTTSLNRQEYSFNKHPHYAEREGKNKTIDLWDAATIDCSITMNSNTQKTIVWQNV